MTDRLKGFTVILEKPIRDDDAQPLIEAISLMRGVARVVPHVNSGGDYMVEQRVRHDLLMQVITLLQNDKPTGA